MNCPIEGESLSTVIAAIFSPGTSLSTSTVDRFLFAQSCGSPFIRGKSGGRHPALLTPIYSFPPSPYSKSRRGVTLRAPALRQRIGSGSGRTQGDAPTLSPTENLF